ncbi:MAG: type II secretion system F family protein [Candidatus Nealsonbacteria bacterium]|nr:type II secretion system F family protein [Candidatus Nealsonbacteria bacterium]
MPKYFYQATSAQGELQSGVQEAKDESELAKTLRNEGYILVSASLEKKKERFGFLGKLKGISLKDRLFFTRNLRLMIKSGISLPKALSILSAQTGNKKFQEILFKIKEEILKGKKLSEALKNHPATFSELYSSMVEIGEETGNLEDVLNGLSKQMERTYELRAKIKGAMVYPSVIIIAMMGIGVLMMITVVPKLAETFEEIGIELPFTTKVIITAASLMSKFWFLLPLVFLIIILLFKKLLGSSKKRNKKIDGLLLKIPVISSIIKESNIAYTARTLTALINAGVPIIKSLEIVSRTLDNFYFREAMEVSSMEVKKGKKLSDVLKNFPKVYPITFSEMLAIGEETGETADILDKIADFAESEVDSLTKNLSAVIEPIIMIIVGTAVGFFAVSMIQPMYSMLGSI